MSRVRNRGALLVAGLSLLLILILLPYYSYTATMLLVQQEWGMTSAEAGWVFGATQVGYVVAVLLLVPLTDRTRTSYVLLGSAILSVVGNALFALLAHDVTSGALLRALAGAGIAGTYMPGLRMVSERFPGNRRGGPAGLYVASFVMGGAVSFAGTGAVVGLLGWRGAYLAMSLAGLGAVALAGLLVKLERAVPRPMAPAGRAGVPLLSVLRSRPVLLMTAGYTAHVWELYGQRSWMAPFLASILVGMGTESTGAVAQSAFIFSIVSVLGIVSTSMAGGISDRFGRTATAGTILAISATCSFTVGWVAGAPFPLVLALCLLYGFSVSPDSPIYMTGVTEVVPRERLGAAMAFHSMSGWTAGIVAPVAFGLILDLAPPEVAWGLGFGSLGLGACLGLLAMLALRRSPESALLAGGRR